MRLMLIVVLIMIPFYGFSQTTIKPFLFDIVKQFPNVRDTAISPNGEEIMFSAQSAMGNVSAIISVKKNGKRWGAPKVVSFSGQYFDIEPFFSKDGLKLYFASSRPLDNSSKSAKDFDIWYVERNSLNDQWSQPKNMGSPINTDNGEFYPSIADNGNFYFTRDDAQLNRKDDIYRSVCVNGVYFDAKPLSDSINSEGYEFNAFISPDESYLIYSCYGRKDGLGSGDLYISFKTTTGWTAAKNLGKSINTDKMDYGPFVDTKTNILYFTSKIDNTNTTFDTIYKLDTLLKAFYKPDNGLSRLYKISIDGILSE